MFLYSDILMYFLISHISYRYVINIFYVILKGERNVSFSCINRVVPEKININKWEHQINMYVNIFTNLSINYL